LIIYEKSDKWNNLSKRQISFRLWSLVYHSRGLWLKIYSTRSLN